MKRTKLLLSVLMLSLFLFSCKKDQGDKEKIVELTIYPETGYGASVLSDIWTEPLLFSDSEETSKQLLTNIVMEGFNFDYQRGYKYKFKVKKVWMQNPPQDVSSVKYVFIELLSKTKVTTDSEKNLQIWVSPETVKFTPKFPNEFGADGSLKVYDALRVNEANTNDWMALTAIEGFDFEAGYKYSLIVKKVVTAEPYSVKYVLLNILSKEKKK